MFSFYLQAQILAREAMVNVNIFVSTCLCKEEGDVFVKKTFDWFSSLFVLFVCEWRGSVEMVLHLFGFKKLHFLAIFVKQYQAEQLYFRWVVISQT